MYCIECGKKVNEKALVCIHCGVGAKNVSKLNVNQSRPVALSIWAMIFGILSMFCLWPFAIPGYFMSKRAMYLCDVGRQGGRGMAVTGYILSFIGLLLGFLLICIYGFIIAFS